MPAALFAVSDFIDRKCWLWTDKLPFIVFQTKAERLSVSVADSVIDVQLDGRSSRRDAAARINAVLKSAPDDVKEEAIDSLLWQAGVELPCRPPPESRPVTWDELREMDAAGVEIESHTVTHPILPRIDSDRLVSELTESRRRLEEMLDHEVNLFCYPNGDHNRHVRDEVARAGYRLAVTTEPGLTMPGAILSLPSAHPYLGRFDSFHPEHERI